MNHCILSMDIGGTNIRAGMIDKNYEVHGFVVVDSTAILTGDDSVKNLTGFIKSCIRQFSDCIHPIGAGIYAYEQLGL